MKENLVNFIIKLLASHQTIIHEECVRDIYLKESDIIRHIHSGSHVLQTNQGFFRFCPSHTPFHIYCKDRVNYHLKAIPFDKKDFEFLNCYFALSKNLKDFVHFSISRRYTDNIHQGFVKKTKLKELSYYTPSNSDEFDRNLYDLAYYVSTDISQYKKNRYRNQPQTFSANRILAQEELASILGIDYLFPHTDFVNLHITDQVSAFGILMKASGGIYPLKLGEKLPLSISSNLQSELTSLNIHDVICNEKDHRPGNYHILLDESNNKVNHIAVFDNDCRWTFFPSRSVTFRSYASASPLVNENGEINRPFLDKKFANNLMQVSKAELFERLSPYLNKLQLLASFAKINRLKKAINKTVKVRKGFLLDYNGWNDSTISEELSGKFGNTYLCIYYNWYERMVKEHPELFNSYNINMSI